MSFSICKSRNFACNPSFPRPKQITTISFATDGTLSPRRCGSWGGGRWTFHLPGKKHDLRWVGLRGECFHAPGLTRVGISLWCNSGAHCATLIPFGGIVSRELHLIHPLAITFTCQLPSRRVRIASWGEADLPFNSQSRRNVSNVDWKKPFSRIPWLPDVNGTNFTEEVIIMKLLERAREAQLDKWTELGLEIKNNVKYLGGKIT